MQLLCYLASRNEDRGIAQAELMSRRINTTWGHPFLTITIPSKTEPRIIRVEDLDIDKMRVTLSGADLAGLAYKLKKRELILEALFELAQTGLSNPFRDMTEDGII